VLDSPEERMATCRREPWPVLGTPDTLVLARNDELAIIKGVSSRTNWWHNRGGSTEASNLLKIHWPQQQLKALGAELSPFQCLCVAATG